MWLITQIASATSNAERIDMVRHGKLQYYMQHDSYKKGAKADVSRQHVRRCGKTGSNYSSREQFSACDCEFRAAYVPRIP